MSTHLDYCNAVYTGVNQISLSHLQLVQNAATRLLTGKGKWKYITPILTSFHWLPVSFQINVKILLFVFKSLNGLAPQYISDLLHVYTPSRSLSLQISCCDCAFSVVAPKLWNQLPLHIKMAPTLETFKSHLKTHFYSMAFNSAYELCGSVHLFCCCFFKLVLLVLFAVVLAVIVYFLFSYLSTSVKHFGNLGTF